MRKEKSPKETAPDGPARCAGALRFSNLSGVHRQAVPGLTMDARHPCLRPASPACSDKSCDARPGPRGLSVLMLTAGEFLFRAPVRLRKLSRTAVRAGGDPCIWVLPTMDSRLRGNDVFSMIYVDFWCSWCLSAADSRLRLGEYRNIPDSSAPSRE